MKFSELPQVDKILNLECFKGALKPILTAITHKILNEQRELLKSGKTALSKDEIIAKITDEYIKYEQSELKSLINATGVCMHTNLGRSVIDERLFERAKEIICSYSNLEYDLQTGERGNRYDYTSRLLSALFGCEDALIVNNNASAVFLVLNTFAKGGETIVSRGELVEIGGSFRVPDVMSASGTELVEVGTTNKTRLSDYENAINENTKMLLKVHRSNFDIVGFSQSVSDEQIATLGREKNLMSYYDLGSGYVGELPFGLGKDDPNVTKILKNGINLMSFSGDKLFGSVQCGIILGKREFIARLRKNQLLRMLRVDKVIISLFCESVKAYINKEFELITTMKQLYKSVDELTSLATNINANLACPCDVVQTLTFVGGGSLPNKTLPSVALKFGGNAQEIEAKFRACRVIGRIENGAFLLDLRSILDKDIKNLINIINKVSK
ncbi:L-seryl-tRNA(Sec) selenium transferase [Campylobacter sp. faydin G-140]|uniref:L-seryl-tRNA(Sec) selenium transferase n=1 Tax=Campylobacter anatolicus TaxID=2829105 RepID=UPI001BA01CB2|nr:L-seryl-tRNA(Sec) selenium transferase [Campylobacter anatolicus]MBR8461618.1 L-seryl-tRNA(Sec) selenium transferase [Campylobacter anatolicus]MBR8465293.1 L-seryl-tRNA(Sec) selenium transferase [Campylobacter anatolicus]